MELLLTISNFGKSALGALLEQLVRERAKRGVTNNLLPIELERHLFRQPMDLHRLLSYVDGVSNFVDGNVPGIVGVVLTFHPYSQEISVEYLIGPNDSVHKDKSRSIVPKNYVVDMLHVNYPDYVSALDHLWQRAKML